jgi:hypothetical protein
MRSKKDSTEGKYNISAREIGEGFQKVSLWNNDIFTINGDFKKYL